MPPQSIEPRSYPHTAAVAAFPLGGIGAGNVSLGARGDLRDWEIFNRPAKGTRMPNTFFVIRAQAGDAPPVTRVLEGPLPPPHARSHGYHPSTAAGLPRLRAATLRGAYPLATVTFADEQLPLAVELEAYTPLVPLDPDDSGIPCAVLTYRVQNTAAEPVRLTIVGSLFNAVGGVTYDRFGNLSSAGLGGNVNEAREEDGLRGLLLRSTRYAPTERQFGELALATTHPHVTIKPAWLRGAWWDELQEFWDDLVDDGLLTDLGYTAPSDPGRSDTGSVGVLDTLAPGERREYRFVLAWYFPNRPDSWKKEDAPLARVRYAARFGGAWEVARYVCAQLERLEGATRAFERALWESTLPEPVVDALAANIVPLRSTTCFWMEDGRFYGWEGCFDDAGCCEGSCTHVWAYAYTMAFLFPSLEREMRRLEFTVETDERGYMFFRGMQSTGERFVWHWGAAKHPEAALDGQMGSVIRVYREWLLSGDRAWLETVWPGVKRAMAYAARHWDTDGDGVPDGVQHNTYDIEFYGPNPLCGIYYLAALRAAEELARAQDEPELAHSYRAAFERGSARLDELLWNGEYYVQRLPDVDAHKYQHGAGILADQLLGQLHARVLGLGDLLPAAHVRQAIRAIFDHNFRRSFREHVNAQRTYALNDEAGLLLCTWPRGGRPRLPFPYSDEVWTGFEYQVAAHLIYEGWLAEGLEVVAAARARHDGVRRNPWNEVECGHHYARTMSSWALLTALSGFRCDVAAGWMSFEPLLEAAGDTDEFRCLWSCGRGWGSYVQRRSADGAWTPEVTVLGGDMTGMRVRACGREWDL
ncbi:MAG TPA: GH116 family glycosyl-hydrolase [Roseiflexaceae bacterium]|nr:GH116 family glycosyl-hydrolase [Roseiflexaceae bacterium]